MSSNSPVLDVQRDIHAHKKSNTYFTRPQTNRMKRERGSKIWDRRRLDFGWRAHNAIYS